MENRFAGSRVWDSRVAMPNGYMRLLKTFDGGAAGSALLRITADSNYAFWLNGTLGGFGQYADYAFDKVYDTYAVTLLPGENLLAVEVYCLGEDCSVYLEGDPGVAFDLWAGDALLCSSDGDCRTAPAADYTCGPVQKFSPQLSFGFLYDRRRDDGWQQPGYVPKEGWQPGEVFPCWPKLRPRPVERLTLLPRRPMCPVAGGTFTDPDADDPARRISGAALTLVPLNLLTGGSTELARQPRTGDSPLTVRQPGGDGVYLVLDMGAEDAGLFDLDIDAPAGTVIDVGFGEHLTDGRVRAFIGGRSFGFRYVCRGGRQAFTHLFKRIGCRYLQLHIHGGAFTLYYAGIRPTVYPVTEQGGLRLSDRLHRMIYETCLRTLVTCMHEHYEDCPWREQALYTMDSRNQMLCGYYAFREYRFPRACLQLMAGGLRADGLLSLCFPAGTPDRVSIPSYSPMFVRACCEYVLYSGDYSLIPEVLPVCEKVLDTFRSRKNDLGLVQFIPEKWNFYEWAPGLDGGMPRTHSDLQQDAPINCFYVMALEALEQLLTWSGRDASAVAAERQSMLKTLHRVFFVPEKSLYASYILGGSPCHYAELTQSLMLYCGVCPEGPLKTALLDTLIDGQNGLVKVTSSHSIFKYEVLLQADGYADRVFDELADKFGAQLRRGATTFFETEEGESAFGDAGSLCHGWSAVPAYLYYAYLVGLRPGAPGVLVRNPVRCGVLSGEVTK